MRLTTISQVKSTNKLKIELLKELTHNSKNLYNKGLFHIRQYFFNNNQFLSYPQNDLITKQSLNQDNICEYYQLNTNCSQQVLKNIDQNFKSFFKLFKLKQSGKYQEKVKIPKYLDKKSHYKVTFSKTSFQVVGNQIRLSLPKYLKDQLKLQNKQPYIQFSIPKNVNSLDIKQIQLIPNKTGKKFKLAFIYEKLTKEYINNDSYLGIDLGLNNFVSMINSKNGESILLNGRQMKSINRQYNKEKSILQSLNKKLHNKEYSNTIDNLTIKRNLKIKNLLHKYSTYIIKYCLNNDIRNIVIGQNKQWKSKINIGKKNNQNFVNIPHSQFIEYIKYKGELNGIKVITTEESYTSKCDSLSLEEIKKQENYSGKRVKRGLYQSGIGKLINADINGAINIIRKVLDKSKQNSLIQRILSNGCVFQPLKLTIV